MGHSLTAGQQFDAIIESVQQEALAAALALGFECTSRQKLLPALKRELLRIEFHDSSTAILPVSLQTGQCMIVSPSIAIPGESPMHAAHTPGGSSSSSSSTGSR